MVPGFFDPFRYSFTAMAAAVSVSSWLQRLLLRGTRLLAQSRKGIKLAQDPDHRKAAAIGSGKCCGDPGQARGHHKALFLQSVHKDPGKTVSV